MLEEASFMVDDGEVEVRLVEVFLVVERFEVEFSGSVILFEVVASISEIEVEFGVIGELMDEGEEFFF